VRGVARKARQPATPFATQPAASAASDYGACLSRTSVITAPS